MYTEYSSQNVYQKPDNYEKNEKPKHFLSFLWKIVLVVIVFILLFLLLIKFDIISLDSSISPTAVLLNQNEIGIKKGSSYQLVSTVLPEDASNKQVIWTSSDPSIVSVNEVTGYLTGLKEGTAIVSVKTLINDKTSECVVNVTDKNILVNSININEERINLAVGYTHSLTYRTNPSNATELNLKFTSSDSSVAKVNSNGIITGIKEGNAIITVSTGNNISDTTYVTVYKKGSSTIVDGESLKTNDYPEGIKLSSENISLSIGTTTQLLTEITPSNANKNISWSSSNSSVATVDSNGLVTAKGNGTATIVAKTVNNLMATCTVTVGNYSIKLKSILITTDYTVLPVNSSKQLAVAFTPSNATNKMITWSSSDPKVAQVDSSGNVKAISQGSAIITAKSSDGGYIDTVTIEVVNYTNYIAVKTISFASSTYSVGINQTITLNPIITPSDATNKSVEFSSSDSSIAVVDENGLVKGLKEGTVTITAISAVNRLKASVTVNVNRILSTGVSLNKTKVNLKLNETFSLIYNILPSNATNQSVSFVSENPNVATVDSNGIITAVGRGSTTITVSPKDGGASSTCLVVVE